MSKLLCTAAILLSLIGCTSKESVRTLLKDNPDILVDAIQANPEKIITALNTAARSAQEEMAKNREKEANKAVEESIEKPLQPVIRDDETIIGPKDAPLTLVIYSDFECPYCSRGFKNEQILESKYKGKIRTIFKHLPLPMHPNAMIAAQYYEGVRLQSGEKAKQFHDKLFSSQQELQKGEAFLKVAAKAVGADMAKLAKDVKSEAIKARIEADMEEAKKFGVEGTPGYLINGVPVFGAYPVEHFDSLIEKLKAKGKVTL
jgi:protein-disulfide isomerase